MEQTGNLDAEILRRFEQNRDFTKIFLDAYLLLNPEGRVLAHNQWLVNLLGLSSAEIKRCQTIDDLLDARLSGTDAPAFRIVLESGSPQRIDEVEARILQGERKGEVLRLIVASYPYLSPTCETLGACLILRDVTAETGLQEKYDQRKMESITDPLTSLYSRRYFEDWIERDLERCRRTRTSPALGIVMLDLDRFKRTNDEHGHQAGDYVLFETARALKRTMRKADILGRYGGEEILAVLSASTPRGACIAAEKYRQTIEGSEYTFNGERLDVTTSVGVTIITDVNDTRMDAIRRADAGLYAAKRNGRNVSYANFGLGPIRAIDYIQQTGEE